jgi:hypothetical protein
MLKGNKMKKGTKIVIIIWSIIIGIIAMSLIEWTKAYNRILPGFYFEKYKTAEKAQEALLKIHPIGSDVDDFLKSLKKIKGKYEEVKSQKDGITRIFYDYVEKRNISFFVYRWSIVISVNEDKKVENIKVFMRKDV